MTSRSFCSSLFFVLLLVGGWAVGQIARVAGIHIEKELVINGYILVDDLVVRVRHCGRLHNCSCNKIGMKRESADGVFRAMVELGRGMLTDRLGNA